MQRPRYSTSRQKACRQCSTAKARCERRSVTGSCVRCARRDLPCSYTQSEGLGLNQGIGDAETAQEPSSPFSSKKLFPRPECGDRSRTPRAGDIHDELDFSSLNLICPIIADSIQNRWMQAYIPVPFQKVKNYPPGVARFIYRTLKSYAAAAVHGRTTLPFIHPKQMSTQPSGSPLATCLVLVRVCANRIPDTQSSAAGVLQREMHTVYEARSTYNSETMFAAFQAYLIYALVLFFWLKEDTDQHFRHIMTNLQELACATAQHGLVCAADQQRLRPRWEEWIVAEAKRRTLFVMYLFDSILSTQEGLPTFLGSELRGLPAPAGKLLWQASSRAEWERVHNTHLADWTDGSLTIDELWPMPADLDARAVAWRDERVDRWLEDLDEYGTMLYAITQCTHQEANHAT